MKAVLFDHDGVLVDSESVFFAHTRATFARFGFDLPAKLWRELYLGGTIRTKDIARHLGVAEGDIPRLVDRRNRDYRAQLSEGVPFMAGAEEMIESLRSKARIAVVTGCPRRNLDLIHSKNNFLENFECIITADDCDQTKPHPEPYLRAVEQLGIQHSNCLAVEDSPRGVESAAAAGIKPVLVPSLLTATEMCDAAWRHCPDLPAVQETIYDWLAE